VRITQKKGPDGAEEVLATAGMADIVGEMALLDDLPRSATVTAVDEVTALLLPKGEFRMILRHILSRDPDVGLDLLAVLTRRLREAQHRAYE
jgi:CRP/FNR family transcriptional regulator